MKNANKQKAGAARWEKHPWNPPIEKERLERLYVAERKSQREISIISECSLKSIQTAMKKFGIKPRPAIKRELLNAGEFHFAWKGGKSKTKAGYVLLRAVGHPRATKRGAYVFEHVLVYENFIGRLLVDGEVIHHKDGNKENNNLENLELITPEKHIEHHRNKKTGRLERHGAK